LPADRPALWHPDAGIVHADLAVRTLLQLAAGAGAECRTGERVTHLDLSGDGATLTTTRGEYRVAIVVVTAGAWAKSLLAQIDIDLPVTPTRETVSYFSIEDGEDLPTLVDWEDPAFYALPAPGAGLKAGMHHAGPVTDPDQEGEVDEATVSRLAEWVAERWPGANPAPLSAETCIYTNTSDERFIFERHGPVVVGSACSGHGFKFGPVHGRRIAELVIKDEA
jgi:sarcosine oxidase